MKFAFLTLSLFATSCASNRPVTIPPFKAEVVCSPDSMKYLERSKSQPFSGRMYSEEEVRKKLVLLAPSVQACYGEEIARTLDEKSFNLCLVMGHDSKGKIEFFEFSTSEYDLSDEFRSCLNDLRKTPELKGFKSLSVTQPFRLFPKRSDYSPVETEE